MLLHDFIYLMLKTSVAGTGNPLQYSCLENFMDRGAWRATVHGVAKSQTRLSDFTSHTKILIIKNLLHLGYIPI